MIYFLRDARLISFLFITLSATFATASYAENNKLVFSTFPEGTPYVSSAELLLKYVYKNIGYDIEVIHRPSRRALRDSNTGALDGELVRTSFIENDYGELMRVPFPLVNIDTYAYSFNETVADVSQWHELDGWRVGTVRGARVFELETPGVQTFGNDFKHLFELLTKERIDAMVSFEVKGVPVPAINQSHGQVIHRSKLLGSYVMYHYVHKKHEGLVKKIVNQLSAMQANGVLEKIYLQQGVHQIGRM